MLQKEMESGGAAEIRFLWETSRFQRVPWEVESRRLRFLPRLEPSSPYENMDDRLEHPSVPRIMDDESS
jgi:hypothetical protein